MSGILWQDVVDQTITNTATETNVAVGTVPSGEWVGREVDLEQTCTYNVANTVGRSYTIRVYVESSGGAGGTLVMQMQSPNSAKDSTTKGGFQRWALLALDSSTLLVFHWAGFGGPTSSGGLFGAATTPGAFGVNKVTGLSLSGAVEIRVTVQMSSNGVGHTFVSKGVWACLVSEASGDAIVTPATVAAVAAIPAPTVQGAGRVAPATVAGIGAVPAPTVRGAAVASPATVAGIGAIPAPTVTGTSGGSDGTASPATVAAVATVPAPTVQGGGKANPATVTAVASVPAPTVRGAARATPATVAAVVAIFASAIGGGPVVRLITRLARVVTFRKRARVASHRRNATFKEP